MSRLNLTTLILAILPALFTHAIQNPEQSITSEIQPYVNPENKAATPQEIAFLPSGKEYASASADGKSIQTFDIISGKQTGTLFDVSTARQTAIPDFSGFKISNDGSKILIYRNKAAIYRRSFKAEYYVYDIRSRLLYPLSHQFKLTRDAVFSPDGRMVAFVADNNVFVKKIDFDTEVAVTDDGKAGQIINGATDWTYEEEFQTTSTLTWAPDNSTLCFIKFDESQVPVYTLPIYGGSCPNQPQYEYYPGSLTYKYPVAGQPNSTFVLMSYDIDTRKLKEIILPDKNIEYVPRIAFGPTAEVLVAVTLNRDQNRMDVYAVNPKSTVCKSILTQTSNAWIPTECYERVCCQEDGLTVFEVIGDRIQLKRYSYNGTPIATLTDGSYDITSYYGRDAMGNHYFQGAWPTALDRTLFKYDVKKRTTTPISRQGGTTTAVFSDDCSYFIQCYSNTVTPPVYSLCANTGKLLRALEDNSTYAAKYLPLLSKKDFITVQSDGIELNGYIIRPKDFDPTKKYPVVMYQYSGPGSQCVLNRWEMDWMYYFALKGFIVACFDGRGTGGRGVAFMQSVYGDLGHLETIDQINAARQISSLPGVDKDRIGIFGWSYGGYEALKCATNPGSDFAAAVAVAPVTDWRFYDTVYTERYMKTPQQNQTGYERSSAILQAGALKSHLLIMYGTADDNVHPANSLQFVSALQQTGGYCDMFVFPNKNHSIYGCNARAVVYGNMYRFFCNNL